MEWLESIRKAIDWMEAHLLEENVDPSRAVSISPFYLQKGFRVMTGYTLGEYVRCRRLYLAGLDVLAGREKALLIDTGMTGLDLHAITSLHTDLPLQLLNTHADRDHIAGNAQFQEFYMHPSEAAFYRNVQHGSGRLLPVFDGDLIDLGGKFFSFPIFTNGEGKASRSRVNVKISCDCPKSSPSYKSRIGGEKTGGETKSRVARASTDAVFYLEAPST